MIPHIVWFGCHCISKQSDFYISPAKRQPGEKTPKLTFQKGTKYQTFDHQENPSKHTETI